MPQVDSWVTDRPRITDSVNSELIRQALVRGPIYLRHALYHGGGSPHWDTIKRYEQFLDHLAHANAGDWFFIWSLADLIATKLYFLSAKYQRFDLSSQRAAKDFSEIKRFLERRKSEVFLVFIPEEPGDPLADFNDLDGYSELVKMANTFTGRPVNLSVFDMEVLWKPEHLLVDAKFPNASGEVPVGGAY